MHIAARQTADLLIEMLREALPVERERVSRRLSRLTEVPDPLLRLLLHFLIAAPVLMIVLPGPI